MMKLAKYPEQYKKATGKGLWSGKDNEVSLGDRDVWGNINVMVSWQDQQRLLVTNDQ